MASITPHRISEDSLDQQAENACRHGCLAALPLVPPHIDVHLCDLHLTHVIPLIASHCSPRANNSPSSDPLRRTHHRLSCCFWMAVLGTSQLLPSTRAIASQANALAPPLSIASISSADRTARRKRAGNSSRSKNKPLPGSMDPSAAAGAAPMPSSLRRDHVFWRGPYC